MDTAVGIAVAVLALVAVDRLVAHGVFDRRRPPPRRRAAADHASGALADLIEVFQPNRTHVTEEQARQRDERLEAGDSAPPVDLDAGTADLRRRD